MMNNHTILALLKIMFMHQGHNKNETHTNKYN